MGTLPAQLQIPKRSVPLELLSSRVAVRTGSVHQGPRADGGSVVVLPFAQLLVEQVNVVRHPVLVEELVELLVVDPVRAPNLAVQVRRSRPDLDMADVQPLQVPVEI